MRERSAMQPYDNAEMACAMAETSLSSSNAAINQLYVIDIGALPATVTSAMM